MATKQAIIKEIGDFIEWGMDGPLAEWLEEAKADSDKDNRYVEKIIKHIQAMQPGDIK